MPPKPRDKPAPRTQPRLVWWLSWVDCDGREMGPRHAVNIRKRGSNRPLSLPETEGAAGIRIWYDRRGGQPVPIARLFEDVA